MLNQTYKNWELIIVNDCSTDSSVEIVEKYIETEKIKLFNLEKFWPAVAETKVIEKHLVIIAFLDSDDLWYSDKLEKQLNFMVDNDYNFTATDYEQIDEFSNKTGKVLKTKDKADYKKVLTSCPIGNLTVIYNVDKLGKFVIPNIRKKNDYVLWLQILKERKICLWT